MHKEYIALVLMAFILKVIFCSVIEICKHYFHKKTSRIYTIFLLIRIKYQFEKDLGIISYQI